MNLTIYRGEVLISEVPLKDKPIRLGRGKDNEVVLEDPGKGVSRVHAELRPEGNRYRLVDLDSQNGIWVSGEKVPSVLLVPGVVAVMGPFRVAINAVSPVTQAFTRTRDMLPDTGTEIIRPIPPSAPAPVAVAVDGLGTLLDDPSPAPPLARSPQAAATGSSAKPSPAAATKARPGAGATWYNQSIVWLIAGVVLIAACGFGAYKLVHKSPPKAVWDSAAATTLANSGRCQEALDQQINPALRADPNNAEAQSLKQKCTAPPPTTSIPPTPVPETPAVVTKTATQTLDEADTALAAKDCQAALAAANTVLTDEPNDARAKEIAAKATGCLAPPSVPRAAPAAGDAVVKIAPADGGLEPQPGESGKAYKARVDAMKKRYDDAVAQLQAQHYSAALRELEAINAAGVPQGYRELAQRRGEARNGIKDEANRNYTQGLQAEQRSDWNGAIDKFNRAHELDPARDITPDIARINDQKLKLGHQLCNDGMASYVLSKIPDAVAKLNKAVELLPSNDDCYVKAKETLAKIGR